MAEIDRLVRAFAELGVWKVRLTGGRAHRETGHLRGIVRVIAAVPGVRRIGLTTNGYRLAGMTSELRDAGLSSLNMSVDSLDSERFERITGSRLSSIVAGVEAAVAAGIPSVKVNVVLLEGMDEAELEAFLSWTRDLSLTVRFIELMRTRENAGYFRRHHLPAD